MRGAFEVFIKARRRPDAFVFVWPRLASIKLLTFTSLQQCFDTQPLNLFQLFPPRLRLSSEEGKSLQRFGPPAPSRTAFGTRMEFTYEQAA